MKYPDGLCMEEKETRGQRMLGFPKADLDKRKTSIPNDECRRLIGSIKWSQLF